MKSETPLSTPYSNRFQQKTDVESYEAQEYGSDSYSSCIWRLQQPVLQDILDATSKEAGAKLRLLDFACGSGRILSFVEPFVDSAEGVDISAGMVELARQKCRKSVLRVGDILREPELLRSPYDIITSFRFLLNVEDEIRRKALHRLREVIRTPGGRLIVNVHGNSRSLRHPAIVWNRWRQRGGSRGQPAEIMLNEMSLSQTRRLLAAAGFEVVQLLGFGVMPPTLYRTPLRGLARAVDSFFAARRWCPAWSVDLLLVCQPKADRGSDTKSGTDD